MSWVQHQPQQQPPQITPATSASLLSNPMQRQNLSAGISSGGSGGSSSLSSTTLNTSKQQLLQQNVQHHLNNNQPTQQHWPQQNYLQQQQNKTTHAAAANPYSGVAPNSWPQQQQQPSVAINANAYHQQTATTNNWQQPDLQAAAATPLQPQPQQATNYSGYFTQQPPLQDNNFIQQQQQYNVETSTAFTNYQQPQATVAQPQQLQQQQTSAANDSWNDWDWNDNSKNDISQKQQQQKSLPPQSLYNANMIDDSFNAETNNDNWQWGIDENTNQLQQHTIVQQPSQEQQQQILSSVPVDAPPPAQFYSQPQVPTVVAQVPKALQQPQQPLPNTVEYATQVIAKPLPPTSLPLVAASAIDITATANSNHIPVADVSTDNIPSAIQTTTSNNIPSPVYVSQAKPVSKPSRQYASPPGVTPTELPETSALLPPDAFQNQPSLGDQSAILSATSVPPPPLLASIETPTTIPAAAAIVPPPSAIAPPFSLPPPVGANNSGAAGAGNTFKRAGLAQHHRSGMIPASAPPSQVMPTISSANYVVPPPPADFANPIQQRVAENLEPDNSEIIHENQEVISIATPTVTVGTPTATVTIARQTSLPPPPNDERNQYLQTSHLSENPDEELNIEADNFPPPGLSRLVLGQPELEASQRMVTGTEVPSIVGNLNIDERQADGEDTTVEQPTAIIMTSGANSVSNIDITADRNLYLVPGESTARNEQRVVTGVERIELNPAPSQVINEQREIELDGENLEDEQQLQQLQQQQQQQQPTNTVINRNEPPLEGAAANSAPTPLTTTTTNPIDPYNTKDLSNISTGNDESDQLNDHRSYNKSKRKNDVTHENKKQDKQRKDKQRSSADRYESEDSPEYPSDHERERRRNYRESSVRSDRDKERDLLEKKRRENRGSDYPNEREKVRGDKHYYRVEGGERSEGGGGGGIERRPERRSQRHHRYDADSKYETEESTRHESTRKDRRSGRGGERDRERGGDRSEREYDDYNRRYHQNSKRDGGKRDVEERKRRDVYADDSDKRRRAGGGGSKEYRDDYDTLERRNRREKHREYEDYRKQSSRNARESDLDKEQRRDPRYDGRHAAMYGYPPTNYGYDPYAYYYEQMARTNPQAYAEWYKKYYGHAAATHGGGSGDHLALNSTSATDGRESVHSGRSSANNSKDRYTHAYISQANEYHRHFMHQQQLAANMSHSNMNSTMLEEASVASASLSNQNYIYGLSGGRSTGNLSQIHTNAAAGYYAVTGTDVAYYARSDYADSRSGNLSLRDPDTISTDPQRLTPCKFVNGHAVVSFSAGLLITVKPKYTPNGVSNIVKLLRLGANDGTRQLLQAFPGPLVRGLTHKKTIIEFCEEQIRMGPNNTTIYAKQTLSSNVEKYKASYTLMWNLLILLLRQNGMVVGTDIADVLLKNQSQFPYIPYSSENSIASSSIKTYPGSDDSNEDNEQELKASGDENADAAAVDSTNIESSTTSKSKSTTVPPAIAREISDEEVTAKFRNYLIYGNVNEALDWATDNNLWGPALFLASKMSRRTHANVMTKFANQVPLNDPIQTLYQLMSGRTPSSVTSVQDEKWGDWRPHLSIILSNTSQKPELDRKAITTLGDTLFNRGDLYAAHFCYLMAQVGFGRYLESATQETTLQQCLPKLVLLGSSHYKTFKEFTTNESIMMTEIYEYACSLNDDKFSLIEFQPYKYLFATRLLDYGYQLKALMYMEQISAHIQLDPSKFDTSFINKVYELADRLKFYDPALEKTLDDPQNADGNFNNNTMQNVEDQKWLQMLRGLAVEYQVNNYCDSSNATFLNPAAADVQNQIDQQFAEINKQFSELNMQYNTNNNSMETDNQTNAEHLQQELQQNNAASENIYAQQQQQQHTTNANHYDPSAYAVQEQQQVYQNNAHTEASEVVNPNSYVGYDQQYLASQQTSQNAYYDPTQQQQQQLTQHYNAGEMDAQQSGSYDYWATQTQQHQQPQESEANARPTISMPNTKNSYGTDGSGGGQQQGKSADANMAKKSKNDNKDNSKNLQASTSNQNSGWFGGIWNKITMKPKNQMILPDDKNPSIVWDADKKRWVNTTADGDEIGEDALKPPPKMSDLVTQLQQQQQQQQPPPATSPQLQQHQQQQQQQPMPQQTPFDYNNQYGNNLQQPQQQLTPAVLTAPSISNVATAVAPSAQQQPQQSYSAIGTAPTTTTALEPTKPPSLQSNMFKMQRNRTLKNSYVDVFNPSGAPMSKAAESVLAPALPPAAVPQSGFFIPGAVPSSNDAAGGYQQQPAQQEMSQDLPQFYNPNQFGGASGSY